MEMVPGGADTGGGSRKRFTGHERDEASGLDYFLGRYETSGLAVFLSVDPSDTSINGAEPMSWNRYAYVRGSPITRVDLDGLTDIEIVIQRAAATSRSTPGTFRVEGTRVSGVTLELPDLGNKNDVSRIPAGEYQGARGRGSTLGELIWVKDVPERTDVAMHAGNTPKDTKGCVLVGTAMSGKDSISQSQKALKTLLGYVDAVAASDRKKGEATNIVVRILDPQPVKPPDASTRPVPEKGVNPRKHRAEPTPTIPPSR
jgi:RHS repeat-associated protein